jgi:8-oxo-dGTP pyrophosphatase MutT (NUDIX family)
MEVHDITPEDYLDLTRRVRDILGVSCGGTKKVSQFTDKTMIATMSVAPGDSELSYPNRLVYTSEEFGRPITSYGCILRYESPHNPHKFMVIRRRDSVDYIDMIKGNYRISRLPIIIKGVISEERKRILTHKFSILWEDMTGLSASGTRFEKADCQWKFIKPYIKRLFQEIPEHKLAEKNMWLFPKGKPEFNGDVQESPLKCAVREFTEETNGVEIVVDENKARRVVYEEFTSTNSKRYRTEYYVFSTDKLSQPPKFTGPKTPIRQTPVSEVMTVKWMTLPEIKGCMISRRVKLITDVENYLSRQHTEIFGC